MSLTKDSEVCVLKALVKKNTGFAGFDLALDQLGQDQELELECLHAYARPWDGLEDESGSFVRDWKLTVSLEYQQEASIKMNLAPISAGARVKPKTIASIIETRLQQEGKKKYLTFKEKPCLQYQDDHYVIKMPGGFYVEFNNKELAALLGFYSIESPALKSEVTDSGGVRLSSTIPDFHSFMLKGNPVALEDFSGQALEDSGPLSVKVGPSTQIQEASYTESAEMEKPTVEEARIWINKALSHCLDELGVSPSLLICANTEEGIKIMANQEVGPVPFTAKVSLNSQLCTDIHEESGQAVFHFGVPKFTALARGLKEERPIGQWNSGDLVAWSDPLSKITPFYLVSDSLEGSSYLSRTGNVSVVAYVGRSLRVQLSNPIKTRGRAGRISLRFLDSEMRECVFSRPFKLFLVFRMSQN